jgi:hypothetical protein
MWKESGRGLTRLIQLLEHIPQTMDGSWLKTALNQTGNQEIQYQSPSQAYLQMMRREEELHLLRRSQMSKVLGVRSLVMTVKIVTEEMCNTDMSEHIHWLVSNIPNLASLKSFVTTWSCLNITIAIVAISFLGGFVPYH